MLTKAARIISGCVLVAIILYAAQLAVRDCSNGLFVYDNCLWLWLREQAGLPNSRLLHWFALFLVGLALLGGLYLTIRYVFPRSKSGNTVESE
ncbi:MAG: hypothetical protein ACRD22_08020 [Terriglobia bacterium]